MCVNHGIPCEDSGTFHLYMKLLSGLHWDCVRSWSLYYFQLCIPSVIFKKKIFCYSSSFLLYIYLCYLITLLVKKASGTIANVQTCLKEHYYQHKLKCLKYLLNVELLQPSNGVIICVMGFSNTSENRAGYKWELCNFVQLTFTIVQCDNICVPCISIYSQVHYHKCSIWQNKEKDDILKRLERERMDYEVGDFEMSTLQHAIMSVILTWTNREGRNGVKKSFYSDLNRLSPTQYSKVLT